MPNVHLLKGAVGQRPLTLAVLVGKDQALLIDTGCAGDIDKLVLPALQHLRVPTERVGFIINTHCDSDHHGGNAEAKSAFPRASLACGGADRSQIEDPSEIWRQRYDAFRAQHHHHYSDATRAATLSALGRHQLVDTVLYGGEYISLERDWILEVMALPGHSRGHLGILDSKNGILFGGDAIHGAAYRDLSDRPALCPTYLDVPTYRDSIQRIRDLPITRYVGCHWPVAVSLPAIHAFCDESLAFVECAEAEILASLTLAGSRGLTLTELCKMAGSKLGDWPDAVHHELCYAFVGHLRELTQRGDVREETLSTPYRYFIL